MIQATDFDKANVEVPHVLGLIDEEKLKFLWKGVTFFDPRSASRTRSSICSSSLADPMHFEQSE